MGKTEGKAGNSSRSDKLLIGLAVLALAVVIGAIFMIPQYRAVSALNKANKEKVAKLNTRIEKLEKENKKLISEQAELSTIDDDTLALQNEVFSLAAQLEQNIKAGNNAYKICYITIDDGPYYRGEKFLELFEKYDVKATFFLCTGNGNHLPDKGELSAASMYPEYVLRGHTIGNHTYNHNYKAGGIYESSSAFMAQVEKQTEFTKEATGGYTPVIVRFPGGTSSAGNKLSAIEDALRKKGYGWSQWTVDTGDSGANKASASEIVATVKKAAEKQDIMVILCHEWSAASEEAMPEIIEYLQSQNYIFMPLFLDSVMVDK